MSLGRKGGEEQSAKCNNFSGSMRYIEENDLSKSDFLKAFPQCITLELTNACNLSCIMCHTREFDTIPPTFLSEQTLKRFFEDIFLSEIAVEQLRLFWTGEPLLHPQFKEIIGALADMCEKHPDRIPFIAFDTNGTLCSKQVCDSILRLSGVVPLHIIFSLDAATEPTYSKIRVGGNLKPAIDAVEYLLKQRKLKNLKYPKLLVQFIVMKENVNELSEFISSWKAKFQNSGADFSLTVNASMAVTDGLNLRLKTDRDGRQQESNTLFLEALKSNGLAIPKWLEPNAVSEIPERGCCYHMFRNIMIRANGEVTICANDLSMTLSLGNINNDSIGKILTGKGFFKLRLAEIFGRYEMMPKLCQNCRPDKFLELNDIRRFFRATKIPMPPVLPAQFNVKTEEGWRINIVPEAWNSGHFDDWDVAFLEKNDEASDGFAFVLGRYYGQINYKFDFPEPRTKISSLRIRARVGSHSKKYSDEDVDASEIELYLNGVLLGRNKVKWVWPDCPIQEWIVKKDVLKKVEIKEHGNILSFVIPKDSKNKNGITICSKPLSDRFEGQDIPIQIEVGL